MTGSQYAPADIFECPFSGDVLLYTLDMQMGAPRYGRYERDNPLDFVVRCSQVCMSWRQQILDCSSLWGKLIDLNALGASNKWRQEVLRRTGTAPLWVTACILNDAASDYLYPAFLALLEEHWERIEIFSVEVALINRHDDQRWSALQRPAPNLRSFDIFVLHQGPPYHSADGDPIPLLSDTAPALQHIKFFLGPSGSQIRVQAPWLGQLHSMSFTCSAVQLRDILAVLPFLGSLEVLDIKAIHQQPRGEPFPGPDTRAALPRLATIAITGRYSTAAYILSHIQPASGCSVFLMVLSPMDDHHKTPAEGILSTYARNFWDVHQLPLVEMTLARERFRIHPWKDSLPARPPEIDADRIPDIPPEFSVKFEHSRWQDEGAPAQDESCCLFTLGCIPVAVFASITHLEITTFPNEFARANDQSLVRFINALTQVEYFALSLTLLVPICTGFGTFTVTEAGNATYRNPAIRGMILPALHTLKICESKIYHSWPPIPFVTTATTDEMTAMLRAVGKYASLRRHSGLPKLRVVDMTDLSVHAVVVASLAQDLSPAADSVVFPQGNIENNSN